MHPFGSGCIGRYRTGFVCVWIPEQQGEVVPLFGEGSVKGEIIRLTCIACFFSF